MTITVEIENATATVTLNRPDKKNAVSMEMRTLLWEAFERIAEDDAIRAVVLTGAGTDFCSGMDVGEMGSGDGMTGSMMRMRRLHRIGRAIYSLKKPVIAAVSGICVGAGWSYALSADIVLASETARFAQIFRKIALAPDAGAVWLLSQQIGQMRAKEIVYSGRILKADEALRLGLVLEVLPPDALLARAKTMAADFAAGPTLALAQAKRQFQLATTQSYDDFLEYEFSMQPLMTRSEDHHEGITAFKERRPPEFKGR
jgi:2-(1,2-epoxy-1,2-dihydrophenyl)acetyl-CoA isomerase